MLGQLVEQDHIEQRLVHLDAAVVINKAELAKAVHKEANTGSCGADHVGQGFLRNGGNVGFWFSRFAEFRHQEKNSRQALFAGVEELIYKIRLRTHAAAQQKRQEQVGESMLFMHDPNHLIPTNPESRAGVHGNGGR